MCTALKGPATLCVLFLVPLLSSCIVTYDFRPGTRYTDPPVEEVSLRSVPKTDYTNPTVATPISYDITPLPDQLMNKLFSVVLAGGYPASAPTTADHHLEATFRDTTVFANVTASQTIPQTGIHCSVVLTSHPSDLLEYTDSPPDAWSISLNKNTKDNRIYPLTTGPPVTSYEHPPSSPLAVAIITGLSSLLMPYATDRAGYSIEFNVYVDGTLRASYPYEIRKKGFSSLLSKIGP